MLKICWSDYTGRKLRSANSAENAPDMSDPRTNNVAVVFINHHLDHPELKCARSAAPHRTESRYIFFYRRGFNLP